METCAEKWGVEAYSFGENAITNRVYFSGDGWSESKDEMHAFTEAESIKIKAVFERQGLNLVMHKMTNNNPQPTSRSDFMASRGHLIG